MKVVGLTLFVSFHLQEYIYTSIKLSLLCAVKVTLFNGARYSCLCACVCCVCVLPCELISDHRSNVNGEMNKSAGAGAGKETPLATTSAAAVEPKSPCVRCAAVTVAVSLFSCVGERAWKTYTVIA